jgi:general stress protein YciG
MNIRHDKLGRRIPDFDRSKANKKGAQTRLSKDPETFSKMGKARRKTTGKGYFGKLKEKDPEALSEISRKAALAKRPEQGETGL